MKKPLKRAFIAAGALAIVGMAFVAGRAWASGIPASGALTYSGLLQDSMGAPLSGTQFIEVKFWNDVTAMADVNLLCDTGTPTGIGLVSGRFSISLPDKCTSSVGNNVGIWAEVLVGPAANAAVSLGRAKLGAVPYAVEANNAVSATAAAGALDARIQALENKLGSTSVLRAHASKAISVPPNVNTLVVFDAKDWDVAGEFDTGSSAFSPKTPGYYLMQCHVRFEGALGLNANWGVYIARNGTLAVATNLNTASGSADRTVSTIGLLQKGDRITCLAAHDASSTFQVVPSSIGQQTSFEAVRLP